MKAWGRLNSSIKDAQLLENRYAGKKECCDVKMPIAAIEPLSFPASQLPSFNLFLL
jgi:hypothetical protein